MEKNKKSTLYYFNFFNNIIGFHTYIFIALNFIVGILDGFGLLMFVPLLELSSGKNSGEENFGKFDFLVEWMKYFNIELGLTVVLIFMVFLFSLKGIISYIKSIYFTKLRLKIARHIRFKLVDKFEALSYEYYTKLDTGLVQNGMITETGRLINAMTFYFKAFQNIIMLIIYISLAFISNWKFAIFVTIGGVISNLIFIYLNKVTKDYSKRITSVGANFNGILLESINYYKYFKATNYFPIWKNRLHKNIYKGEDYNYKIGKISSISDSLREPLIIIVIALVIVIQIKFIDSNMGLILTSLILFYRALANLATLQSTWNSFLGASAGVEAIETLLNDFSNNQEKKGAEKINSVNEIQVKDLSLNFGNNKILDKINLEIKPKTSIAFVGTSGAGKTTLANVIAGLINSHDGEVIIEGKKLKNIDLGSYRNKIGYITQEPVIFNGSIYENVTFWEEKTKENLEKFFKVMEMVSMTDFINSLEKKEDSLTGIGGILMSGGQKQRISIARELYKEIDVLVLDEATSALDSETEMFIKNNIDLLHGKYIMIIIAHRLSTIKNVDTIFLMEEGKIIDKGNFNQLLNSSTKFKKMVELQEVT